MPIMTNSHAAGSDLASARRLQLRRRLVAVVAILLLAVAMPSMAFAQRAKDEAPEEETKGYTLPYFFTVVAVLSVVVAASLPSKRAWDVEFDEETP